jgi:hypothetical protein
VFSVVSFLYLKLTHREVSPDRDGLITLRPGPISIIMGLICVAVTCLSVFLSVSSLLMPMDDRAFFLIAGPPLAALMGFGTVVIFWIRVRVSEVGVEHKGLKGWKSYSWDRVKGVTTHAFYGPRIHISDHRSLYFWPYGYGANEIQRMFLERGKPFEIS